MRFQDPQMLWMALIFAGLPIVWRILERRAFERFSSFANAALLKKIVKGADPRKKRLRVILACTAMVFASIALARPQMGSHEEILEAEGLDIVFLLDVSNSMLTEDTVPNRLKKAKHMIRSFVDRLSGDRAGVIAFAGSAYPAVPLTTDYEFIRQTLEVLDESAIANQGSDLQKALEVATGLLVRGGLNEAAQDGQAASQGSQVIVVLSDGEDHDGITDSKALTKIKELGIQVYSIGVGSAKGGPIPMRDAAGFLRGYKKDPSGGMVHSKLESAVLKKIASLTGGKYFAASDNEGEIEEIIGGLNEGERTEGEGRRVIVYDEVFIYPLTLAVVLLFLAIWMSEAAKVQLMVLLLVAWVLVPNRASASTSVREYHETKKGVEAYEQKDFPAAAQHFGNAQALNPDSPEAHLNLGDALMKSGSHEAAAAEFEEVTKSADPNQAARGSYNLGKAFEAQENFEKALQSYQNGLGKLLANPDKADPEVVQRLKRALERTEQQKQQQNQNQNQKKNDEQKDGKSDDPKKGDESQPKYKIPKQKPQFKPEKISEGDAKRILQRLKEEEKKSQQRMMQKKTEKPKDDKSGKDW